jgi:outer membrane protein TolC
LKDWRQHLKTFNFILASCIFAVSANAIDESILSSDQIKKFDYSQEKIDAESAKEKIDWVNPITYTYLKKDGDSAADQATSTISIDQPIFRSGGIYYAIKYANASQKYQNLDLLTQKKMLIKDATKILFQLHQADLNIKKQTLKVQNSEIEVRNKKEQVFSGVLDVTTLNNALIELNKNKLALEDLKLNKQSLEKQFDNLSSQNYKSLTLPKLSMISKEDFKANNLYVKKAKMNEETLEYANDVNFAKYLPSFNFVHSYTDYHEADGGTLTNGKNTFYSGLKITMPLDIKSGFDTQASKIAYLKSKVESNIVKQEEENFLETTIAKVDTIKKKIDIQNENIKSYNELIVDMIQLEQGGFKTKDDVAILQNSQEIETLNQEIYKLDLQIELLEAYARTN